MFVDFKLYSALNVLGVTSLLNTYMSSPALFIAKVVPPDFQDYNSINFYHVGPLNCALNYGIYNYSVNCRSNLEETSKNIADAVKTAINREHFLNCFAIVFILESIAPQDETDVYNTPIEVIIKTKEI